MFKRLLILTGFLLCSGILVLSGCSKPLEKDAKSANKGRDEHPEKGPHDGELIELGKDHKYHAELLHDEEKGTVTIYLLGEIKDGKADPVYIDAEEIVINLKHDGKPEQFKLKGVADENAKAPEGKFSKFVSEDKELATELDHEDAEARLVVTIEGTSYNAKMEHDHEGHKH